MMEWIYHVSFLSPNGLTEANVSVVNAYNEVDARRRIIHKIVADGGHVVKIQEPTLPLDEVICLDERHVQ